MKFSKNSFNRINDYKTIFNWSYIIQNLFHKMKNSYFIIEIKIIQSLDRSPNSQACSLAPFAGVYKSNYLNCIYDSKIKNCGQFLFLKKIL